MTTYIADGEKKLSKYSYFWLIYVDSFDTWQATNQAIALVQTKSIVKST
ncbi:MAG: hypothetical protein KME60_01995 [Cyanomargarita calcarea GSE-NOS-MK-12-04C]|jgi:ABC-type proline/glycine betaine transport system permease subunit|uniref:Uncharacterized protein n=1 Tax=Cyanomargarita calcarea GSE-NOS-MK-12-04C TaxID=2839659 RepID=A0A951QHM5_9CYAN|nr:hypothetical protein [Cyanomargarita calcarea GSE-NOS-MK-12-04C]